MRQRKRVVIAAQMGGEDAIVHLGVSKYQTTARDLRVQNGHFYITKMLRKIRGTVPKLTFDEKAEYHTDSDSASDDGDPADGQLGD